MHARSMTSAPEQWAGLLLSVQPALDLCISIDFMGVSSIPHIVVSSIANCSIPKGLPILYVED